MRRFGLAGVIAAASVSSALAETRTYDLADFTKVAAAAGVETVVTVGLEFSVVAESTPKGLERFEATVTNGELRLRRINSGFRVGLGDRVAVRVTLPSLEELNASSGAKIDATGINAGSFSIGGSSGATVDVEGVCENLAAAASSGANIDAEHLVCHSANINSSSGSRVIAHATDTVAANASSGGNISIRGSPENLSQTTSSGGTVRIRR